MKRDVISPSTDGDDEISGLIETLLADEQRLEELTGGEVDTIAGRDGRTFLLRRAQDQLSHNEAEKQAAILNALPANIALINAQGIIISINDGWRQFAKANAIGGREQGLGTDYVEIFERAEGYQPLEAPRIAEGLRSVLTGKAQIFSVEYQYYSSTGQQWFLLTATPLSGDRQNGVVISHLEITERKRAENERTIISQIVEEAAKIAHLDEFLKVLHHAIGQLVYAENCFVMLHDAATDIIDVQFWVDTRDPRPDPKLLSKGFSSYVLRTGLPLRLGAESRERLREAGVAEQVGTASASWMGVPLRTPTGVIGVLVLQHYEIENVYSDRDLEFLSSVGDQIALAIERKRAIEALEKSEERYRELVENAVDIIYTQDLSGNYTSINKAAERITGYTKNEARKVNMSQVVAPGSLERAKGMTAAKIAGEERSSYELEIIAKDGRRVQLDVNTRVICANGVVVGIQGIARDITGRKRIERALEESKASFKSLFDTANDAIMVLDNGVFVDCNPCAERMFGCTKEWIIGRSPMKVSPPVQPDGRLSTENAPLYLTPALRGDPQFFEWEHLRMDGTPFNAEVSLNRVDFHGKAQVQAIIRDITERKRAEKEIELALQRLKDAQRLGRIGDWEWDLAAETITWSTEVFEIVGRDPLLGPPRNYEEMSLSYDAPSRELLAANISEALRSGKTQEYELVIIRPDGERVFVQAVAEPKKAEDGKVFALAGTLQDISARRIAETALSRSEVRYHSLFENMLEGYAYCQTIFEHDKLVDFIYTEVNGAFETLTGLKDVIGKKVSEVLPGLAEADPALFDTYGRVALTGQAEKFETYIEALKIWLCITVYSSRPENFVAVFDNITERKLANASLLESEERYRTLFETSPDGVAMFDLDMNILVANDQAIAIFGYSSADQMTGKNAFELITEEYRPRARENIKGMLASGRMDAIESVAVRGDGTRFSAEFTATLIRDGHGEPAAVLGVTRDISERKLADARLGELRERTERRERMLTTMLSSMSDFAQIYDREGRLLFVNQPLLDLWDRTLDEVVGKNFRDLEYPVDLADKLQTQIERVYRTKKPITDETPFVAADGTLGFYEYIFSPAIGPEGNVDFVVGSTRDVTERNLAAERLRSSEENLAKSQQIAHLGSWDLVIPETGDVNNGRLRWSDEVYRIFGYEPNEVEASNDLFFSAVHPDDRADVSAAMAAALLEGNDYKIDHRIQLPDGTERYVHEHSEVVRNEETGKITMMVGTIQDITNQRLLEEQYRQSQKMEAVGVLAGGIAHDFNNLLTAINGYSELTIRKMAPEDPLRKNIEQVKNAGERAAELTGQLLAFSRKQVLKPAVINLNTVIGNIENMLRRIIKESIDLRVVLQPELGNIRADQGQIEQVLMNLAVNARDAMPGGGVLTIETKSVRLDDHYLSDHPAVTRGDFVRITVSDTGTGIDAATLPHIFEPFFTTKEVGKGTGLGLSTVYGIVKQSGGDVLVYSESGHGSTFKVYLPCVDESVQPTRWSAEDGMKHSGTETILLAEDEEIVRTLVCEILTASGYKVLEAKGGEEALAICAAGTEPIHLLLTDIIMPKMGGSELREHVVKLLPDIKVLFMSGYTDDSIAQRSITESNIASIEKPFTPDALAQKVREVLGR